MLATFQTKANKCMVYLVKYTEGQCNTMQSIHKPFDIRGKDYVLKEHQDILTGISCFPGPSYHIEINRDIPPVQHAWRQVTAQLQQAYKKLDN